MAPLSWRRLLCALLALPLLAAWTRCADVEAPVVAAPSVALFPAAQGWGAALPQVAQLSKVPGLEATPQALAPVAFQLTHGLGVTPQEFAAMPEADRASAVHLAVDAARQELLQKSYELMGESKRFVFSHDGVTKQQLDAFYPVAAQLREIDKNYGPLLDARERQAVAQSAASAASAWREARAAYVARFGEAEKKALEEGTRDEEAVSVAAGAPPRLPPFTPGQAGREMYEAMKRNKYGDYSQKDFATLLTGYGFTYRDTGGHRMYTFERYPRLSMPVPRHNDLKAYLVSQALDLVERRMELSAPAAALPALAKSAISEDDELPPPPTGVSRAFKEAARPAALPEAADLAKLTPDDARPQRRARGARPATAPAKSPRRGGLAPASPAAKTTSGEIEVPAPKAPPPVAKPAVEQARFEPAKTAPEPPSQKLAWWQRAYQRLKGE